MAEVHLHGPSDDCASRDAHGMFNDPDQQVHHHELLDDDLHEFLDKRHPVDLVARWEPPATRAVLFSSRV